MTRRKKIIIVVLVLLALLVLLSYIPVPTAPVVETVNAPATGQSGLDVGPTNFGGTTTTINAPAPEAPKPAPVPPKPAPEANVARLAASFAERYGSYSNADSEFTNLLDLKVFMSAAMAARTDAYVENQQGQPAPEQHRGVTTRAINTTVQSYSESGGTADIMVKTQRQEFIGNTPIGTVKYQDIEITFIKEDGTWKADTATWQ